MDGMKRPNILIFCTDEQRGDHLGCMGHPHLKTPNIDRIASEGTLFRNCYSSSPVCMPARATMFTGLANRASGVYSNGIALDESLPTLPGMLAGAGYRTHSVGKIHLKPWGGRTIGEHEKVDDNPERRIFWNKGMITKSPDNYYGFQTQESVNGHVNYVNGDYVTWLEKNHPGAYEGYKASHTDPGPLTIDPGLHYNKWIADRSVAFIKKAAGGVDAPCRTGALARPDRQGCLSYAESPNTGHRSPITDHSPPPFFLWCSFPDPHEPFAAVKKWSDVYDDVEIKLPQNTLELSPDSRSETMNRMGLGTKVQDPDYVKKCIWQTYGMISHIDEQVGRVLDALEEQGIADNTIVMFISDHGDQLGEHGLFYKGIYPYDAHAHIPFVAKVPWAEKKGKVVEDVVSMLDLVPTVLDLAGVKHPDDLVRAGKCKEDPGATGPALPGEVLTPVLEARANPVRKNALIELDRVSGTFENVQMRALVTNDYKLVFYAPLRETMLFDRKNDRQELKNLAGEPEYQSVVNDMLRQLLAELARTEMRAHCQWMGA